MVCMPRVKNRIYDALALFSGGLDSILAMKMIQEQNLRVLGIHFISPFFGKPGMLEHWEKTYGLELMPVDVSREYVDMLARGPKYGLGRFLNPCVDCKILMLKKIKIMLKDFGARFIISGEVLGQRPMSQRRDTLFIIRREAGVSDELLRVLSARLLPPTRAEKQGLVNRSRLGAVSGRGRKQQMHLARHFNIREIPTPAGGCLLTVQESCKRYLPLLKYKSRPDPEDFQLASLGRQFWSGKLWLTIGRNRQDNEYIQNLAREEDCLFRLKLYPGPLGLGRSLSGQPWSEDMLKRAAALVACYSPKARKSQRQVDVVLNHRDRKTDLVVWPGSQDLPSVWNEPQWSREEAQALFTSKAQLPDEQG